MAEGKFQASTWDLSSYSKEDLVFMARLAEQAERYEEMKSFMKRVAEEEEVLDVDERNLLSVAYKNVIGARRASWRVIDSIMKQTNTDKECVKTYLHEVEDELTAICKDILLLLNTHLLANQTISPEQRVFYFKMKGDYHRYMAEYTKGSKQEEIREDAKTAYLNAIEHAKSLPPTNPIRLGLALNFSVFYYEILQDPKEAIILAKSAFDQAVGELQELNEEQYKDATLIMQLLRDNLTLWQSEEDDADDFNMEEDGTAVEDL